MLLHLPAMEGHSDGVRVNNGPALAGHGGEAVRDAIAASITTLPEQLRRSLTWDQDAELSQHAQLRIDTGLAISFCDPHTPGSAAPTSTPTACCASASQGHQAEQAQRRQPRSCSCCAQQPAPEDPRMEDAS
jgi:hypothetical protein